MTGAAVPTRTPVVVLLALAALSPAGLSPAAATGTPPPAEERCAATVSAVLRWPGGFEGQVALTNRGSSPMYAWYVSWELPTGAALAQVWNGIAMVSGPTAMVHAPSWHSPLGPGETAIAGFLATGDPPDSPHTVCG